MGSRPFTLVSVDLRVRGILQVVLGLMLPVLGALYIGVALTVLNIVIGAVLFGGLGYPRISKTTQKAFAIARPATELTIEPVRETYKRALYQGLIVAGRPAANQSGVS